MIDISGIQEVIPTIVDDIMYYFAYQPNERDQIDKRSICKLTHKLKEDYDLEEAPDSVAIREICDCLCKLIPMVCLRQGTLLGLSDNYYWDGRFSDGSFYYQLSREERKPYYTPIENAVFGFRYIYKKYRDCVIPIIYHTRDGKETIGSGFLAEGGYLISARHCLEGAVSIAFIGIVFDIYRDAKVYYHKNACIDVAVVLLNSEKKPGFKLSEKVEVFDRVIAMGYPRIPGFTCFNTAEEAVVSATPEKRFAVSEGQIAAEAQEIWSREQLFLVTAKIRGGNSGGPIINQYGECIGITSSKPDAEGDYDDLGYGTVVPARFAIEMCKDLSEHTLADVNLIEHVVQD